MEKRMEKWESLRLEAQKFIPQEYCEICIPKYKDIYETLIGEPTNVDPSTHFYPDLNGNHILDPEERNEHATTNHNPWKHVQSGASAFMCWEQSTLEAYWAVIAQNDGQYAISKVETVKVKTEKLFS